MNDTCAIRLVHIYIQDKADFFSKKNNHLFGGYPVSSKIFH